MSKFITIENSIYLLIIITCIFFSISYSFEQIAVDAGLVISGIIKYPENNSIMKIYYFNSWTFLHQFAALLLKLDLSIINVSRIILFFSSLFFFIGIYLISKSITSSSILSFFITLAVLFFRKSFGDVDYPTLIFSVHSNGMMSLAISTLVFGLISNRNLFLAGFFSILLLSIHLVVGAWIIFILSLTFFLTKIIRINLNNINMFIY